MKEKDFLEKIGINLNEWNYPTEEGVIGIPIYYATDDEENINLDFEGMTEEFEDKLNKLRNIIKENGNKN